MMIFIPCGVFFAIIGMIWKILPRYLGFISFSNLFKVIGLIWYCVRRKRRTQKEAGATLTNVEVLLQLTRTLKLEIYV